MTYQEATRSDLSEIFKLFIDFEEEEHEIQNAIYKSQGLVPVPLKLDEKAEYEDFEKTCDDSNQVLIVARDEQKIVGYASGKTWGKDHYEPDGDCGFFSAVFVSKGFRNKGIGTVLCNKVEEWLESKGCVSITIQCFSRNEGAKYLYEKRGYKQVVTLLNKSLHETVKEKNPNQ